MNAMNGVKSNGHPKTGADERQQKAKTWNGVQTGLCKSCVSDYVLAYETFKILKSNVIRTCSVLNGYVL